MPPAESVAIFWDYENCSIPGNLTGYEVVNAIRRIAQEFGSVTLFKAYLGVSEQVLSPRSLSLRSELQASGVSLIDCPHNGRKDVADKMMLGKFDMLAHAIDNPTPSTFLLISGDRDFSYALSILRLRRYRVVLITSPNAHASLTAQASLRLNWVSSVLDNSSISSPKKESGPSNRVNFSLAPEFHKNTSFSVVCSPRQKTKGLMPPPREFASDPDSTLVMAEGNSRKQAGSKSRLDIAQNSSAPPTLNILHQDQSEGPSSFFGSPFRLPAKSTGPRTPNNTVHNAQEADMKGKAREAPVIQPPMGASAPQTPSDLAQYEEYLSETVSSRPPSSEEAGPVYDNYELWDSPVEGEPVSPPVSPRKHSPRRSESSISMRSSKSTRQDGSIPSRFKPLVKQLQLYRSKGIYIPQRAILCIDLGKRYKRLYEHAGVEDFAEYVSAAEQEGFVTLGGGDGLNPWIMLRQEWVSVTI